MARGIEMCGEGWLQLAACHSAAAADSIEACLPHCKRTCVIEGCIVASAGGLVALLSASRQRLAVIV
jgi:hypothetical protein